MYNPPYIFFHREEGYSWEEGTDPALHKLPTLNKATHDLLPSLTINVSRCDGLMTWLKTNDASLITDLTIFLDATTFQPRPERWCVLFDKLQHEATNIRNLSVYWDAEGPWHIGLGKSVVFVRGLALLKVKESVDIGGMYAKHWPRYLEEKMQLKPVNRDAVPGSVWIKMLRDYQRGTEHLNPWINPNDGKYDLPRSFPELV
ncbi:hypothetical protein P154DRAFT_566953 [Amniculicola lignicola CBS 123094]|uniref:Uncharacterized protein n=1 Tax=Amniculicola lignicola CBS 123094 TaxID=1392246 RepID=A0A6A5W147_9PLEO|nr:hypothetical protein P154DRAFT_566953 [Amniculicola lignicola CBS 123094]